MFNKIKKKCKKNGALKVITLLAFDLILVGYYALPGDSMSSLTHLLSILR